MLPLQGAYAQSGVQAEYRVKAVFVYNFTQFIDWPADAFENPQDPLIIGVLGPNPFGTSLDEAVTGEKVGNHPIQVRYYKEVSEINNCHILYINLNQEEEIKRIINALRGRSTVIINDHQEFPRWGGTIRFFINENKVNLVINTAAARAARLRVSSKLLRVAQIY